MKLIQPATTHRPKRLGPRRVSMNQMGAVAILGGALVFVVFACRSPGDINPQGGRSAIDAIVGAAIGEAPSGRGDAKPLEVDIMLPLAELIPDPLWVGEDVAIRVHPLGG